jgi:hypothetical protein
MAKGNKNVNGATTDASPLNGQHEAEYHEADYLASVERFKAAAASMSDKQWVLGDEAAAVTKVYGENRLAHLAEDGNFSGAVCTLGRYRSVCFAFPKTGGRPRFFASAQALQAHPDRIQIVTATPSISVRAARELMRLWRAERGDAPPDEAEDQADEDQLEDEDTNESATSGAATSPPEQKIKVKGTRRPVNDEQADFNESKRELGEHLALANKMIGAAEASKRCTPEQLRNLGKAAAMSPASVETMEQAAGEWLEHVARLKKAAAEEKKAAEGRIRTSPKSASSEPAQAAI